LSINFETDAMGDNGQAITFIYKKIAEPITIQYKAVTYAGTEINMGTQVLTGLIGQNVTSQVVNPLEGNALWYFDLLNSSLPVGGEFILGETAQTYINHYRENTQFSQIIKAAESTDDKINFENTLRYLPNYGMTTLEADSIPNYDVIGWEKYDSNDVLVDSGSFGENDPKTVAIDPINGNQRVVFIYNSRDTSIYIRCLGPNGELLDSFTKEDARVGEKYTVIAPYLDYWSLDDDLLKIVDPVGKGTNVVTFRYAGPANVVFELYETGTTEPLRRMNVTATGSYTISDLEDELSELYYTFSFADPAVTFPLVIDS